jgi:tyrosine-protein kinase Etk/Wzc
MLQSRYEEAHLAELSVEPDLSVLDSASTPEVPVSSRGRQFFLLTIVGGFAGATVLALLLDRFDKRIRYLQQVPSQLRLNVVGAIPHVVRRSTPDALNVAQLVESFRSLRLGITYAIPRERPLKLTITSAGPADGKSFVSSNLALAFAESGYRTLLIDGDVRRGTLHKVFNTERRPGLVEVLRGESTLAGCSRATTHPYLSLLSSGARLKSAPELLASESFRALMDAAQPGYDVILIDSPPLAAGMDPHALCVATGNVLFVVRLAESNGDVARQKLDLLERFPVRVIGAVANDVTASVGLNGEYSYLAGYTIHDEDALSENTSITALR